MEHVTSTVEYWYSCPACGQLISEREINVGSPDRYWYRCPNCGLMIDHEGGAIQANAAAWTSGDPPWERITERLERITELLERVARALERLERKR